MEVGARPDGRLINWSSLGQGLTPQVVSTSYLVLGPVPYALARSTYHRVRKDQGRLLWVHPGDQLGGGLKNGDILHFWQYNCSDDCQNDCREERKGTQIFS
jgi:hypothetical protein